MAGIFLGKCQVLENRKVAAGIFRMRVAAPAVAETARPGQFVMVQTGPEPQKGGSPLLKRPFSLHRVGQGGEIALLYKVIGVGTRLLSQVRPGESLEILGPLGKGFSPPPVMP
ncbi:MAG: hypothetical protein V1742_08985, partial [Pseudomonadota bacterium]